MDDEKDFLSATAQVSEAPATEARPATDHTTVELPQGAPEAERSPAPSPLLSDEFPSTSVVTEPAAQPPASEWARVQALALKHLDRFISFEPKVLRGDNPDAIHDMRVASRRLQQVLDLIYPPPAAHEVRRLRRKIRRSRRALSEVRNCDVMLAKVEGILARKRSSHREEWKAFRDYLLERRAAGFEKALGPLSKVNLAVFYVHFRGLLAPEGAAPHIHLGHRATPAAELTPEQFYERIGKGLESAFAAFESRATQSLVEPSAPVVHGVRIAAKRLRYLIEVVNEFNVAGSAEALAWLRQLQQHLGNWHDLEVLEAMMIDMLARSEFLRSRLALAMGVEKLILRDRKLKKGFENDYFQMIAAESDGPRRLKDWVGYVISSPSAAFIAA